VVAQERRTEGVEDTMKRPGLLNRALIGMVSWAERLNQNYSKVGNQAVLATADFPWAEGIEREWRPVRAELDSLLTRKD
jgi:aspartyl/asparaginyl beta-hydroxylase (cupin superfamily)